MKNPPGTQGILLPVECQSLCLAVFVHVDLHYRSQQDASHRAGQAADHGDGVEENRNVVL